MIQCRKTDYRGFLSCAWPHDTIIARENDIRAHGMINGTMMEQDQIESVDGSPLNLLSLPTELLVYTISFLSEVREKVTEGEASLCFKKTAKCQ